VVGCCMIDTRNPSRTGSRMAAEKQAQQRIMNGYCRPVTDRHRPTTARQATLRHQASCLLGRPVNRALFLRPIGIVRQDLF
jgi:hypothetical protein